MIYKLFLLLFLIPYLLTMSSRISFGQEMSVYDPGLSYYSLKSFTHAGVTWENLGKRFDRLENQSDSQLKRAALSYVLATIAYDKANDDRAYDCWSSAKRLYARVNTTWDFQQRFVHSRLDKIYRLYGTDVHDGDFSFRADDYVLLRMQKLTDFVHFNAPRAGLMKSKSVVGGGDPIQREFSLFEEVDYDVYE